MKCEICEKENKEREGMLCGKYKVCFPCVWESIETRMFLLGRVRI